MERLQSNAGSERLDKIFSRHADEFSLALRLSDELLELRFVGSTVRLEIDSLAEERGVEHKVGEGDGGEAIGTGRDEPSACQSSLPGA